MSRHGKKYLAGAAKIDREKNKNGFNGFLRGLLSKPANMARNDNAMLQQRLSTLEIFAGIAQPTLGFRTVLSFVHTAPCPLEAQVVTPYQSDRHVG